VVGAELIASLKVAVTLLLTATDAVLFAGLTLLTEGGVVSLPVVTPPSVVKLHE
jgi:hypothetical protein